MRDMIARGEKVHSIVCDPPYHLISVEKRFGKEGSAPAKHGKDGLFARQSKGFMGKTWDGGDIAFRAETWRLCWELLPPGGYIVAFGSSRTYGHLQVAMEEAGFITHPMLGWIFGQGFPKAHKVEGLDGFAYGGQALKPALEPIYMGQKPMEGTGTANWRKHGVGALNIDGCRISGDGPSPSEARRQRVRSGQGKAPVRPGEYGDTIVNRISPEVWAAEKPGESLGRWPANVVHDGSDEVISAFPDSKGQSGPVSGAEESQPTENGIYGDYSRVASMPPRNDSGSAARFFYAAKASQKDRNEGLAERSTHPTVKPTNLNQWLCRLITPPGGTVLDPFMGSGSTGKAAALECFNFVGIDQEAEYVAIARARIAFAGGEIQADRTIASLLAGLQASTDKLTSVLEALNA